MKKLTYLIFISIFTISCIDNTDKKNSEKHDFKQKDDTISVTDLKLLFENIKNINYIEAKLDSLDFRKKFNGVYISNEHISEKESKHWIHISDIGKYSSLSYSTAEKERWNKLLAEIKKYAKPIPCDDGTSSICIRYIDEKYTFESYEPKNGVNLTLNELYQIFIFKTETE
ncbi:MAG: hypothetical protein RBR87_08900 [Bacteroidales bacterium]|jgi:hypothetical protein|nr:hypothetical protein [Bacteroidales bacterium]